MHLGVCRAEDARVVAPLPRPVIPAPFMRVSGSPGVDPIDFVGEQMSRGRPSALGVLKRSIGAVPSGVVFGRQSSA